MGFIRRRGDAWQARYRAPNGRERSKSFRRKLDAQRWLATQTADLARGDWIDPALGRMTFAEWVPRWQATLIDLRPNSLDRHLMVVRVHLLPRFGRVQLAKIRRSDVQRMIAEDMATGYASSTVRRHVIVLRSVLEAAVQDGRVKRNVARGVRLPPESTRPMRFLDPSEVVAVATSIRPQFYGPLVWTAAYVGLRWGELAGLQLDRIDLLRGTVTIDTQMTEVRGRLELGPPKSKAGFRQVQLPAAIVELLGPHLNSRQCRSSGLAFPTVNGYPLRRGNFRKIWRRTIDGDEKRSGVFAGTELEAWCSTSYATPRRRSRSDMVRIR